MSSEKRPIITARDMIAPLRASGYQSSEYAVAELADNSIDAGAHRIEILLTLEKGIRHNMVQSLMVLDDGSGMSFQEIWNSPCFGKSGVRHLPKSIGRYGVGLLRSSISQCKRLEIYSWKNGIDHALYTYVDIDHLENHQAEDVSYVPKPKEKKIPAEWLEMGSDIFGNKSGTAIVWKHLDRFHPKMVYSVFKRMEITLGRIYRHVIDKEKCSIVLRGSDTSCENRVVLANDPMYLAPNSQAYKEFGSIAVYKP